jgi:aspartate-semialdehyde dehydrogenase
MKNQNTKKLINQKELKLGLVGATGMVGAAFLEILQECEEKEIFHIKELRLFASEKSEGKVLSFGNRKLKIGGLHKGCFKDLDIVFFSGGDDLCKEWAPKAVESGAWAIDNSAAFRMHPDVRLIVPEVNSESLRKLQKPQIVANPNCSTIQLVVALAPLKKAFGLDQVIVASYQASSGAGREAQQELVNHLEKDPQKMESDYFARSLAYNVVPQIGSFDSLGFTSEEQKIIKESKKILSQPELLVSALTVRVPVLNGHAEAVWVRLKKEVTEEEMNAVLQEAPGLIFKGDKTSVLGLTPKEISGFNEVFVGRVHRDTQDPYLWTMWIVADNLRKGAAYNAVQIAMKIFQ